jgi:two-component system cell cycle sensor histidine kinase/response regulator CckA
MITTENLNDIASETLDMFGRASKRICIRENYSSRLWNIRVDRKQIEQVLLNLYINASQAMPEEGTITISTSNRTLERHEVIPHELMPGEYVRISIRDNGIGMSRQVQERIFEPFFTTKQRGCGTGLGLASAFGIVKNHDGFIEVRSREGEGSEFLIFLPACTETVDEATAPSVGVLPGAETILLVDDEHIVLEATRTLLEEPGYTVVAASSGPKAVSLYEARGESIDLVLLDMVMPVMDGKETLRRLQHIDSQVKVVLLSGFGVSGEMEGLHRSGIGGFVQKPFGEQELSGMIRDVLENDTASRDAV